jgi:hypothetical protein
MELQSCKLTGQITIVTGGRATSPGRANACLRHAQGIWRQRERTIPRLDDARRTRQLRSGDDYSARCVT